MNNHHVATWIFQTILNRLDYQLLYKDRSLGNHTKPATTRNDSHEWHIWMQKLQLLETRTLTCIFSSLTCAISSHVIFPAPITANHASENWICKSGTDFISLNSTAALDTDTEPLEIAVSLRTRFPAATALFSIRESTLPPHPSGSMECKWHWRTLDKVYPSPTTNESKPPATRMRCYTASSPERTNKFFRNTDIGKPLRPARYLVTRAIASRGSAAA